MKSFNYSAIPFIRLLIPLLIGRFISVFISLPIYFNYLIVFLIPLGIWLVLISPKLGYAKRKVAGYVIFSTLFFIGLASTKSSSFETSLYNQQQVYHAQVKELIKEDSLKQSLLVRLMPVEGAKTTFFDGLLYVKRDSLGKKFLPGDHLVFNGKINAFTETGNPYAFEYARYMSIRQVKGQCFVNSRNVELFKSSWSFKKMFYSIRKGAEKKLNQLDVDKREFGIVYGLLLGDKTLLEYDTKASFSSSGAIHVLSVSGLHVGIIYLLLMTIVGQIGKGFKGTLKVLVVMLVLWMYAAIAGMSPSVFRATIMFSVFVISKRINHQYNIYHSLAIAAFIILIVNPFAVIHAGFWLSFLAVASIVYFYPQINRLLYFEKPWLKYIWALVSVSLAVQIGTVPLSIYLFGYFPTWFIVSNIMIVPVLPFVLIGSIIVVLVPMDSVIVELLAGALSSLLYYLSEITTWISRLKFAKLTAIQLQFYQVIVLYISIASFIIWQHLKYGRYLLRALFSFLVALICISATSFKRYHEQIFTVHQINGKSAISLTTKENCTYWVNDSLSKQEFEYAILPVALNQESTTINKANIADKILHPIIFAGYKGLILNGAVDNEILQEADFIVLGSNIKRYQLEKMIKQFSAQQLIFDSSFSKYNCLYWKEQLKDDDLKLHFVSLQGAFTFKTNK